MSAYLDIPQAPQAKEWLYAEDDSEVEYSGPKADGPLLNPDDLRASTPSPFSDGRLSPAPSRLLPPAPPPTARGRSSWLQPRWRPFWERNQGVILVAIAQMFGSIMNVMARLLELEGEGMHPFQILFARMGITAFACCVYMYCKKVPYFPLGPPEVRWLLLARGISGFFGISGMWYSIMYLPLAEATVISFLAPCLAGYLCHLILKAPFTRREQIATFVAMFGVLLIARPVSLFRSWGGDHGTEQQGAEPAASPTDTAADFTHAIPQVGKEPTDAQRLGAIGFALMGVLGAAGAFTTIRWIGKRAHALISVNYFSVWCTVVCTAILLLAPVLDIGQPGLQFALPSTLRQWTLLVGLGVCGFLLQFMLTSGLAVEKSNRATCMVYTQMLFAAGFDKWIFGYEMGPISLTGCGFIISSLLWVTLSNKEDPEKAVGGDVELGVVRGREDMPMLGTDASDRD